MSIRQSLLAVGAGLAALASPALHAQQPAATPPDTLHADVTGTVYDSIDAHPIAGATVQLVQPGNPAGSYATRSGADGDFRIPNVAPGRYVIGFQDALLDSLGIDPPARALTVTAAPGVAIALATPSSATLRATLCPLHGAADSSGAILGRVGAADSGQPLAGATVVAVWREFVIDQRGLHRDRREIPVRANDAGWYAICGIPSGALMARAEVGARASGYVPVTVPVRGVARLDLTVPSDSAAIAVPDSAHAAFEPVRRGSALLAGIVRDDRGHAIADATVVLLGSHARATTDGDGRFTLADLPAGSQTVEARKLGFAPVRARVNLASHHTASIALAFDARVTALRPVTIYGRTPASSFSGFLRRRQEGVGYFLTRGDIQRRQPFDVTDLFRMVPGFRVVPLRNSFGNIIVSTRSSQFNGSCVSPAIYLNGVPMDKTLTADLDGYVSPDDIAGIEVYPNTVTAPPQFRSAGCGVILIWTGVRAP